MDMKNPEFGAQSLTKLNKLVDEDSILVNTAVTSPSKSQENNASAKTSLIHNLNLDSNKAQRKIKFTCENHNIIVKNAITNKAIEGVNAQIFKEICKPRILNENVIERSIKSCQQSSEFKLNQKQTQARQTSQNKDVRPKRGKRVSGPIKNEIAAQGNLPQGKGVDQRKDGTCKKNDESQLTWSHINNQLTDVRARLRKQSIDDNKKTKKVKGPLKATFRPATVKSASDSSNIEPAFNERRVLVVFNSSSTESDENKRTDWQFEDGSDKIPPTKSTTAIVSNPLSVVKASAGNVSIPTPVAKPSERPSSTIKKKSCDTKKLVMQDKHRKISSLNNSTTTTLAVTKSPKPKKNTLESGVKALQQNQLGDDALIREFRRSALYKRLEYANNLKKSTANGTYVSNLKTKTGNNEEQTAQKLLPQALVKEKKDEASNIKQKPGYRAIEKLLPDRQSMPRNGLYAKRISLNTRPGAANKGDSVNPTGSPADKVKAGDKLPPSISTDRPATRNVRMGLMSKQLVQGSKVAVQGTSSRRIPVIGRGPAGGNIVKPVPFIPVRPKIVKKSEVQLEVSTLKTGHVPNKPEKLTAQLREEKKPKVVELRVNGRNESEIKSKMMDKLFELERSKKYRKMFNNQQEELKPNKVTNKASDNVKNEKRSQIKRSGESTVEKRNTVLKFLL